MCLWGAYRPLTDRLANRRHAYLSKIMSAFVLCVRGGKSGRSSVRAGHPHGNNGLEGEGALAATPAGRAFEFLSVCSALTVKVEFAQDPAAKKSVLDVAGVAYAQSEGTRKACD